jgi:hypothetical protein
LPYQLPTSHAKARYRTYFLWRFAQNASVSVSTQPLRKKTMAKEEKGKSDKGNDKSKDKSKSQDKSKDKNKGKSSKSK